MEPFLHRGAVVALASISMVFLALSLLQPWFVIHDSYSTTSSGSYVWESDMRIYTRYYMYAEDVSRNFPVDWQMVAIQDDPMSGNSGLYDLMGLVNSGLLVCIGLAWLLTIAAFLNSRLMTFILAWITSASSLFFMVVFSAKITTEVRASSQFLHYWPTSIVTGLFGKVTVSSPDFYSTDSWSWHPGWGWFLATAAVIFLIVVVVLVLHDVFIRAERDKAYREIEFSGNDEPKTNGDVDFENKP